MIKVVLALTLVSAILLPALVTSTSANFTPVLPPDNIVIEADGTVVGTSSIVRHGNVYTFTGNVSGTKTNVGNSVGNMSSALAIHKSNIIIDGAGYTLQGNGGVGIDLSNDVCSRPSEREVWNVTIKNLRIIGCRWSIDCTFGGNHTFYGNCIVDDYTTGNDRGIILWGSYGNNVTRCTIGAVSLAIFMDFISNGNTITENNIVGSVGAQLSGNETVDRNYWSDYLSKYPNATEIDSTGVGSIPYAYDAVQPIDSSYLDNHPLMEPVAIPYFSSEPLPSFPVPQEQEPFPTALAVVAFGALIAAIGIVTAVYLKKRKHRRELQTANISA